MGGVITVYVLRNIFTLIPEPSSSPPSFSLTFLLDTSVWTQHLCPDFKWADCCLKYMLKELKKTLNQSKPKQGEPQTHKIIWETSTCRIPSMFHWCTVCRASFLYHGQDRSIHNSAVFIITSWTSYSREVWEVAAGWLDCELFVSTEPDPVWIYFLLKESALGSRMPEWWKHRERETCY